MPARRPTFLIVYSVCAGAFAEAFLHEFQPKVHFKPLFAARKKKLSMAEKRKRRAKVPQKSVDQPSCKLDFTQASKPVEATKIPNAEPTTSKTMTKAQQLLKAQRNSVAMLTIVKEKMEALQLDEIDKSLERLGYWHTDDFLGSEEIIDQLEIEGGDLLASMSPDMDNLGGGEYLVQLQGGQDQYTQAPRSIEWVVSATKHFPQLPSIEKVDHSKSMGYMRTFDRKAFIASLDLLTGNREQKKDHENSKRRSFAPVIADESDGRKLSMRYYVVPMGWVSGGGLEFTDVVEAKRDRLVIWRSDLDFRPQEWEGTDEQPLASCIELHLVSLR